MITPVEIETALGKIVAEIYADRAPASAGFFLRGVDAGRYDDAAFFRILSRANQTREDPVEMIQAGEAIPPEAEIRHQIAHETTEMTGLRHKRGAISLPRYSPGAVYHSFGVCMGDAPSLDFGGGRNPDGLGFAVFGQVVDGMDVAEAIFARAEPAPMIMRPIPIYRIRRAGRE